MEDQGEHIRTLTKLGLNTSQAKVYLTLVELGRATAKTISISSKLARQEVYRVLGELEQKGLIEKIIALPTEFQPFPVKNGLDMLIKRQKAEITDTEKNTTKLLQSLKEREPKASKEGKSHFILVDEREKYFRKGRLAIAKVRESVDVIGTLKRFLFFTSYFEEEMKKAMNRGVQYRVIVENLEGENPLPKISKDLVQNPHFAVRFIRTRIDGVLMAFDREEAIIVTSLEKEIDNTSTLWTNNPSVVSMAKDYFELKWKAAEEYTSNEH